MPSFLKGFFSNFDNTFVFSVFPVSQKNSYKKLPIIVCKSNCVINAKKINNNKNNM